MTIFALPKRHLLSTAVILGCVSMTAHADQPVAFKSTTLKPATLKPHTLKPHTLLDPLVMTAAKSPTPLSQTPARVTVIDKLAINKTPTDNLSEVLQQDASVYIKQNGGIGQGTTLSLRSTNPNHTLLLKDGVRLNTPNTLSPIYPDTLDLTATDQVEVLKGAASVQHGSDAIGGVVQLLSTAPSKTGGQVTALYGENDTHKVAAKADLVADNGLYASVTAQQYETDGSRIFSDQPKDQKAGYEQEGYAAKLGYVQPNIQASIRFEQNEGINHYSDNGGKTNKAERQFDNRSIIAKASGKVSDNVTLSAHYGNAKDEQKYVEEWSSNQFITDHKEYDLNAKFEFTNAHELLVGATHQQDDYQDAYAYKGSKNVKTTGYYAQHRHQGERLDTQLGVRVEDHDTFGTHTVGQAAARYHLLPTTSVYANVGSAFRAPSLNELYYQSTSTWGGTTYNTFGNPKLKPEQSVSYELGVDHNLADNLTASLSAYQTKVDDLIATKTNFANNVSTSTYENLNKATFTGGELGLTWRNDVYYATANYAYNKSKNDATGLEVAYRPKQTGTLTLGYDDGVYGLSTSVLARSSAKAANSADAVKVPGYATIDVNGYWQAHPHVKVFANVQNIGDVEHKAVWNFGNWYVAHGRQANVGVTVDF